MGGSSMMKVFTVSEDNKIWINDYDKFSTDAICMINDFNNMNVYDRSMSLWELTCRLEELAG
jgi:hypothetical protein